MRRRPRATGLSAHTGMRSSRRPACTCPSSDVRARRMCAARLLACVAHCFPHTQRMGGRMTEEKVRENRRRQAAELEGRRLGAEAVELERRRLGGEAAKLEARRIGGDE